MEEQQKIIDLAAILDNPMDFTDEELRAFFADGEHRLEYIAVQRARQAARRSVVAAPDAEKEWKQFADSHFDSHVAAEVVHPAAFGQTIRYIFAALGGAAAMLLAVLLFSHLTDKKADANLLTIMEYDDSPQQITMLVDGKEEHPGRIQDSVSFFVPRQAAEDIQALTQNGKQATRTLRTPRGMDLKVILPDGSEVWLNAESSLEFPVAFTDARNVVLNGEAYFKVVRDESRPFVVSTDQMNVRVLGTEFNFRHHDTERTQVSLVKGSVEILHADNSPTNIILQPGQGANIDKKGNIQVHNVDTYAVTQWINGFFYFHDQTLVAALGEIGRWYNVGVVFENKAMAGERIHFSALRNETVQQTLDKLNRLMHTQIVVEGNNIVVK